MTAYTKHLVDPKTTPKMEDDNGKRKRFRYPESVLCGVCGKRIKRSKEYCPDCESLVSIASWSGSAKEMLETVYKRRGLTDLDDRELL